MKVRTMKRARLFLVYVTLLVGMAYSALALTTTPAHAACDCSFWAQQDVIDAMCLGSSCNAPTGWLDYCDGTYVAIVCSNGCTLTFECG